VVPRAIRTGIFVDTDLFVALPLDAVRNARDERRLFVTARLKPGVTRSQAEADLAGIASRLTTQYPNTNAQTGVVVRPLIEQLGGQIQALLFLLALIAVLVAAMACANVSNVVLAQAIGRQHDLSVRTALGAQRRDHLKQLAAESLLISLAAGVAGLMLGGWGLASSNGWPGQQARLFGDAALNWRIVAVALRQRSSCHSASLSSLRSSRGVRIPRTSRTARARSEAAPRIESVECWSRSRSDWRWCCWFKSRYSHGPPGTSGRWRAGSIRKGC
jgi:hypothetical protein